VTAMEKRMSEQVQPVSALASLTLIRPPMSKGQTDPPHGAVAPLRNESCWFCGSAAEIAQFYGSLSGITLPTQARTRGQTEPLLRGSTA
jgi:hypothetical protein